MEWGHYPARIFIRMTKSEAVHKFVDRDMNSIPLDWVQAVAEQKGEEIYAWPMWGTMFMVDDFIVDQLKLRRMAGSAEEIDLDAIQDEEERKNVAQAIANLKAECISWAETALLENYVNEEMAGADNIIGTAAYLYEVDGRKLIGINGAGWNFYDGVWDRIYDMVGLEWHDVEETQPA
jgi:hypothetical protein